jgi:acyl carrier protein
LREKIVDVLLDVAREMNASLESPIAVAKGLEAPLYGQEGSLDSLGLVSFVAAVEQALDERLNLRVTLADERAVSQRHSPFRTIGTLADYAASQVV